MKLIVAAVIGFSTALALGPLLIPLLQRMKIGQTVREAGPETHHKKQGTPVMGGLLFLVPLCLAVPILDGGSVVAWGLLLLILGYGALGFADDFIKTARKRSLGLRAREKLIAQILLAVLFAWLAQRYGGAGQGWILPFGWKSWNPGVWYGPLAVLAILGAGNAVNITDGLDGLAGGASAIGIAFFAYVAIVSGHHALAIVSLTLVGGLVAFLRFNLHPAALFMGDTGALSLGAALGGAAVISHMVLLLPVVGVLFVMETLSVIVQVLSFKLTGKRVFRMSPLHHHFELAGWTEERVVTVFWLVAVCGAAAAWWLRIPVQAF